MTGMINPVKAGTNAGAGAVMDKGKVSKFDLLAVLSR
jgi:hypothetical protein